MAWATVMLVSSNTVLRRFCPWGAGLHQGDARPRQIAQGLHRWRRDNARLDEAMGEEFRQPRSIGCVGLFARPLAPRAGIGHDDLQVCAKTWEMGFQ